MRVSDYAILGAQAPYYGPATPAPRISDGHPMWWFPTCGSLAVSGLELWLHASHAGQGTLLFSGIAGLSGAVSLLAARSGTGEALGGLVMTGAAGLAAFGCSTGGSMTAATAVCGALSGIGWLIPEWLRLHREKRQAIAEIEQRRMREQYAWEARQQALYGKALEVEAVAYGVRHPDRELERIEGEIRALTSRLDGIPFGQKARPELAAVAVDAELVDNRPKALSSSAHGSMDDLDVPDWLKAVKEATR
jgi:hypothetical protein